MASAHTKQILRSFMKFCVFYWTCIHPWCSVQKWLATRNEWVRLHLVYKIEFKHIHTLLSHTPTCRCLWAGTHTHTHLMAPCLFLTTPTGTTPFGGPLKKKQVTLFHWHIKLSRSSGIQNFLRLCWRLILWQHAGSVIYCTWGSGWRVVWAELSEAHKYQVKVQNL